MGGLTYRNCVFHHPIAVAVLQCEGAALEVLIFAESRGTGRWRKTRAVTSKSLFHGVPAILPPLHPSGWDLFGQVLCIVSEKDTGLVGASPTSSHTAY